MNTDTCGRRERCELKNTRISADRALVLKVRVFGTQKWPIIISDGSERVYLLLAEFSVRTVNYGPSFFPSIYGPSAKRAGHKSMEKKRGSVIYSTDQKNEAN